MLCIYAVYIMWEYIKYHPAKSWEYLEFTKLITILNSKVKQSRSVPALRGLKRAPNIFSKNYIMPYMS